MKKTLGSLFDGIGGFPLAGSYSGFTTLWASEIEPFPIRVTKIRFPKMKHLGDITKINGADIEPAAAVCGGSPCQDLSVAGLRAGLAGQRSGLFIEQVRIIKEMREADAKRGRTGQLIRPRFMVWENVPGAFSSNRGEDFRIVLEETCRIADSSVHIPRPSEKWATVGAVMGDGFSLAWRVLDAQYWGVPQRRRRIFLVTDFAGQSASKILFKRESVPRNSETGRPAREGAATNAEKCAGTAGFGETGIGYWQSGIQTIRAEGESRPSRPGNVICEPQIARTLTARADSSPCADRGQNIVAIPINDKATRYNGGGPTRCNDGSGNGLGIGNPGDPAPTLSCGDRHAVAVSAGFSGKAGAKAGNIGYEEETAPTLKAEQPSHVVCYDGRGNGDGSTAATLTGDHQNRITDYTSLAVVPKASGTLTSKMAKGTGGPAGDECQNLVCTPKAYTQRKFGEYENGIETLLSRNTSGKTGETLISGYAVRRLTPLECERLQGYPDGWTDIPGASDSARYKALGNSVAVPCVAYIMRGIAEQLD